MVFVDRRRSRRKWRKSLEGEREEDEIDRINEIQIGEPLHDAVLRPRIESNDDVRDCG